jgi:hypothetical protein
MSYEDLMLAPNTRYYYIVEAFDAGGVRSAPSAEASNFFAAPVRHHSTMCSCQ